MALLAEGPRVLNVGVPTFAATLASGGRAPSARMDWQPPAQGDPALADDPGCVGRR